MQRVHGIFRYFIFIITFFVYGVPIANEGLTAFRGDGVLTLNHLNLGEVESIQYRTSLGTYSQNGLDQLDHLLRCRMTGQEAVMPPALFELVDRIQDHFGVAEIEVISGYRSPELNGHLREAGRGVAKNSYHMRGWAMDIRLPQVASQAVRDFAKSLGEGGVGHYPGKNFVHVDIGPVRTW